MHITGLDHFVLTVSDRAATTRFYTEVLGMRLVQVGSRQELHFGGQKINVHTRPGEFQPAAAKPLPGSADFCLIAQDSINELAAELGKHTRIELGPVARMGAQGSMSSLYVRDPDGNLVEISVYDTQGKAK